MAFIPFVSSKVHWDEKLALIGNGPYSETRTRIAVLSSICTVLLRHFS